MNCQRVKRKKQNMFIRISVKGVTREANTAYQACNYCFVTNDILDIIVQWSNQFIDSDISKFQHEMQKIADKTEIKAGV